MCVGERERRRETGDRDIKGKKEGRRQEGRQSIETWGVGYESDEREKEEKEKRGGRETGKNRQAGSERGKERLGQRKVKVRSSNEQNRHQVNTQRWVLENHTHVPKLRDKSNSMPPGSLSKDV